MPLPLISIIVITYNSSKYISETLESAKNQQYPNKELIITDDFSNDETLNICTLWIKENQQYFANVKLVTSSKNTGIAPNINRGVQVANGTWLKIIAGDDILINTCLSDNYNVIKEDDLIKVLFTNSIAFTEVNGKKVEEYKIPASIQKKLFNSDSTIQLFNLMNYKLFCPAPSSFIHKQTLLDLGAFDEDFPFYEDFPFWIKCAKHNIILFYADIDTVLYRQGDSISRDSIRWYHELYYNSTKNHFNLRVAPYLKVNNKKMLTLSRLHFLKFDTLIKLFGNKKNFFSKSFNYIFDFIFFNENIINKKA